MKQSEKLKKQIDEAKAIAEKSNTEAQSLADGADDDPGKAIAAIEKAQSKARAAELVAKSLAPKLAAAIRSEVLEVYHQKQAAAEKAIVRYVESLSVPYRQLQDALTAWEKGTNAIAAAKAKVVDEIKGMYPDGYPYHDAYFDDLVAHPSLDGLKHNNMDYLYQCGDKGFNEMRKRIDRNLELKRADDLIPNVMSSWQPFETESA
jgi:hypothetical protein